MKVWHVLISPKGEILKDKITAGLDLNKVNQTSRIKTEIIRAEIIKIKTEAHVIRGNLL
jgi:hypothetical protein